MHAVWARHPSQKRGRFRALASGKSIWSPARFCREAWGTLLTGAILMPAFRLLVTNIVVFTSVAAPQLFDDGYVAAGVLAQAQGMCMPLPS